MSYYSDTAIALSEEGYNDFMEYIEKNYKDDTLKEIKDALAEGALPVPKNTTAKGYCWLHVSWCSDDPAMEALDEYIEQLGIDKHDTFCYAKVGEHSDDCVEKGAYWDNPYNIGLARTVISPEVPK